MGLQNHSLVTTQVVSPWKATMLWAYLLPTALPETIFGHLQMECPKMGSAMPTSVPVPKVLQHLHLWERVIFVSLAWNGEVGSGTLMILCGTHRGVQVGVLAVIAVVRGSLPH